MDNPDTDTENIGHKRDRTKTNKVNKSQLKG